MIRPTTLAQDGLDRPHTPIRRRRRIESSQLTADSIASHRPSTSSSSRLEHPSQSRPSRPPTRLRRVSSYRLPLPALLLLTTLLAILLPLVSAAPPCVRFADYDSINQMFIDGGPGTKVLLCPNKLYRLSGSIIFTAADQELATYGYPTGSERAVLRVEGKHIATAIQGDCRRCARVSIKSLVVDGNRKKLGRMQDSELATGLVVLGGNEGQSVKNSWLKNPRGFTAVHVREGDKLSCAGAVIEKNEIGPVGEEYDPQKDGDDPEMSPLGRPLADGVSIACRDSFVRDNTFYDNTDAAIVIYCSPGTLVHANHIFARTTSAMAGILLVDSTPFDGDYTGTVVKSNIIDAATRSIRVGIGIGSTVWSDDTTTILTGGSVLGNGLKGRYMGYGIAAAGLKGWTVKDNWDEARHEGRKSARCFDEPVNPDPVGLLYNKATIEESTFQPGFVDHDFQYIVCIDGLYDKANPPKHDLPPLPHDLEPAEPKHAAERNTAEDAKATTAANPNADGEADLEPETAPTGFSTGSEVMDDILEHSQQRMLEAIDHLNRKVDQLAANVKVEGGDSKPSKSLGEKLDPAMSEHMEKLQRRVEHLEYSQRNMLESAVGVRSAIQAWDQEMAAVNEWQYEILLDVRHRLDLHSSPSSSSLRIDSDADSIIDSEDHSHPSIQKDDINKISNRARARMQSDGGDGEGWGWLAKVVLIQGIVVALVWSGRRWWRKRRVHTKLL
ncbi:hypothetical protein CI109_101210 [Kwoniella shandongensis]|uniref:Right handed beta helix domain-containing protein n=1 Tax=Kwoniella shandongensis TaxID=1734106 RepID=A0A5M6BTM8_9TREE|nr:uncharacterized protein CI109_005472 [Kwoniella shandongensis]KAA5526194.1 hypothetical protein CI109_005472 [Kwoniella shandongensis]